MTTGEQYVKNMQINIRCDIEGHDKQELNKIYPVSSAKQILYCSNCLALNHPELAQKVIDLDKYIANKYDEHQEVMKEIEKNKEFIKIVYKDDSIISKLKREEEENIDIAFNQLMRMMKRIIENAR